MHSCIYEGLVTHSRFHPVKHRFQYRLNMLMLDLSEIPALVGNDRLIAADRWSVRSFQSADHLAGSGDLEDQVRSRIQAETGRRPTGRIRLLTQLRYFGYYFSPLNLFYVSDAENLSTEYVLAEVNNTPWGERHLYVLSEQNRQPGSVQRYVHPKQMHVSPFMDMDMDYHWRLTAPEQHLSVKLENWREGQRLFSAGLTLRRKPLTRGNLQRISWRYPWMTAQIILAIHFQALKLWWKRCPVYVHPKKRPQLPQNPAQTPQA
jgi:uncharacterized protein